MGRAPITDETGRLVEDRRELAEDHAGGCPGGWYRSGFVLSVLRYQRPYSNGVFSENILLSRTEDPLIIEAIQVLEQEMLRAQNHFYEVMEQR